MAVDNQSPQMRDSFFHRQELVKGLGLSMCEEQRIELTVKDPRRLDDSVEVFRVEIDDKPQELVVHFMEGRARAARNMTHEPLPRVISRHFNLNPNDVHCLSFVNFLNVKIAARERGEQAALAKLRDKGISYPPIGEQSL